ncbi:MAG TPA: hypothetical protein VM487_17605 [Phycisphaerae bacterium]|nr:hypothetical protein [Phycisphaerae bacterium]
MPHLAGSLRQTIRSVVYGPGRADETGRREGLGTMLNCPLIAGSDAKELVGMFRRKLLPAARKFKPEFVSISAGSDSREDDPLGGLKLKDGDGFHCVEVCASAAAQYVLVGPRARRRLQPRLNLLRLQCLDDCRAAISSQF